MSVVGFMHKYTPQATWKMKRTQRNQTKTIHAKNIHLFFPLYTSKRFFKHYQMLNVVTQINVMNIRPRYLPEIIFKRCGWLGDLVGQLVGFVGWLDSEFTNVKQTAFLMNWPTLFCCCQLKPKCSQNKEKIFQIYSHIRRKKEFPFVFVTTCTVNVA